MLRFLERRKYICITLVVFLANCFFDRLTKYLAVRFLKGERPIRLLHDLIVVRYTENNGAFLSLGADWNGYVKYLVLLILPALVCFAGLFYLMFKENSVKRIILISSIIGGGLSNLADRLFNDFKVIDFLNFGIGGIRTGILNVADLSVTFGIILLMINELIITGKNRAGDQDIEKD
ncbi:hypothetical protein FACS189473_2860 [Spirochaetia bacterium]|nr:hypothetical protein FACS189473_2860 [Spirochaetia bacterium]